MLQNEGFRELFTLNIFTMVEVNFQICSSDIHQQMKVWGHKDGKSGFLTKKGQKQEQIRKTVQRTLNQENQENQSLFEPCPRLGVCRQSIINISLLHLADRATLAYKHTDIKCDVH